jgi:hypothetical protein
VRTSHPSVIAAQACCHNMVVSKKNAKAVSKMTHRWCRHNCRLLSLVRCRRRGCRPRPCCASLSLSRCVSLSLSSLRVFVLVLAARRRPHRGHCCCHCSVSLPSSVGPHRHCCSPLEPRHPHPRCHSRWCRQMRRVVVVVVTRRPRRLSPIVAVVFCPVDRVVVAVVVL